MEENVNLFTELHNKINLGRALIKRIHIIEEIDGAMKLKRKIMQEVDFLTKLQISKNVKKEQLCCSNLTHLEALVDCALRPDVSAVCKTFHVNDTNKLTVDIISNGGRIWTKVIARNPRSLSALSHGNSSFGARSVLDQARDYIHCATLYPCMYKPPQVTFECVNGIDEILANKLRYMGINIKGEVLPKFGNLDPCDESSESDSDGNDSAEILNIPHNVNKSIGKDDGHDELEIDTLNLDVTAMMAYVSNMTNGYCNYIFKQEVLTQQAAWEAIRPVKPILNKLFEGKQLVCCQTAWEDFEKIVNILGGPLEKERTAHLKQLITVYPDDFGGENDDIRKNLKVRGHVRTRSKIIFNFGHRIKALTVSANEGFVRAANQQGIMYAAFIHEPRALSEGKEMTAQLIPPL